MIERRESGGSTMNDAEMDRVFSKQDGILPSSGFTASVMDAVRREAAAPAPIPFPWKRALPAVVVAALVVIYVAGLGVALILELARGFWTTQLPPMHLSLPLAPSQIGIATWTTLSLLVAYISVKISLRLAGVRA